MHQDSREFQDQLQIFVNILLRDNTNVDFLVLMVW